MFDGVLLIAAVVAAFVFHVWLFRWWYRRQSALLDAQVVDALDRPAL